MTLTTLDLAVEAMDELVPDCEGAGHDGAMLPAKWIDRRACGCDILKCEPCAAKVRADLDSTVYRTCYYCQAKILGRLGDFITLERL